MFLCVSTEKKQNDKDALVGKSRECGDWIAPFFFFQWTSLVWLPGVRTAAPYVLSFSDQHVPLLYHQRSLSCQDPRERNTGTGARERGWGEGKEGK